jgi:L-iditol 2-dehydrogenase/L-gulonate 5-dehydrogenase
VEAGTRSALAASAPGGLLVLLGRSPAEVPAAQILLRELDVLGVRGASGYYPAAVAAVSSGAISPAEVVDAYFKAATADGVADAFRAHESPQPPLRAMLTLS